MIRSFKLMQDEVLDDCRQRGDTLMATRVKAYLNQEYFALMSKLIVPGMVETYTFDTVDGTRTYALPIDFDGLIGIQMTDKADDTDYAKNFGRYGKTMQGFINTYPKGESATTDETEPGRFTISKVNGVKTRTTGTDAYTVLSSSTVDTMQKVSVVAYSNSTRDQIVHGEVSLNGTTSAAILDEAGVAMTSYEPIQVSKSDYTLGVVTFKRGTVTISTLAPWQLQAEYSTIEFNETPDAAYGFRIQYKRRPIGMLLDGDVPIGFPAKFTECIELGAKVRARDFVDDQSRVKTAKALYDEKVGELLASHGPAEVESVGFTF